MINIINELKWQYNKFMGIIKDYLIHGASIRLGENPEFIEYLFTTKDGMTICLNIIDEIPADERYFIVFKQKPSISIMRPSIARIKLTTSEYVKIKSLFSKKWVLTKNEKQKLVETLTSKSTWKYNRQESLWELIYERSEQDSKGVGWDVRFDINYPPMPNYMELPE